MKVTLKFDYNEEIVIDNYGETFTISIEDKDGKICSVETDDYNKLLQLSSALYLVADPDYKGGASHED